MRILFLDDDRGRADQFIMWASGQDLTIVTTADHAIRALQDQERFDVVFLDHDLEDLHYTPEGYQERPETTGDSVALWLVANPEKRPRRAVVHSWNPEGGRRMARRLHEAGVLTIKIEFGSKLRDYVRSMGWGDLMERGEGWQGNDSASPQAHGERRGSSPRAGEWQIPTDKASRDASPTKRAWG